LSRPRWAVVVIVILVISAVATAVAVSRNNQPSGSSAIPIPWLKQLQQHYVQGWGFRDELNPKDIDNQNFWIDNAGKILTATTIVNDSNDSHRALEFILSHMEGGYYLPEVVVNSSVFNLKLDTATSITNRIAMITDNESASELRRLWIGDYYAGPWNAGYLGADGLWYNGAAHRANSSEVVPIPGGYSKISHFAFDHLSFSTCLNATIRVGDPYARVSVQVRPMNSTFGLDDHIGLQIFAGATGGDAQTAFENATLFDSSGNTISPAPFDGTMTPTENGILIAYSNRTSVLTQDSVAVEFNSTEVTSAEHWFHYGQYENLSWVGLDYNVVETRPGELSPPVYADIYPIRHLDYRLLSDTAAYLASHPKDVAVSPPVGFGFVDRGLALASSMFPGNQTLRKMAVGYWNFYYDRYEGTKSHIAYARSTNLFALGGFELFQGNQTVEHFTNEFVEAFPGASIEEYGWAAAALQLQYHYTESATDLQSLQNVEGSFVSGGSHYLKIAGSKDKLNSTFEFGETAAALLTAKVPYNSPAVLWAMNAVFASNSSDVPFNFIQRNDLANTETIPAMMLSTWLFEGAMKNSTGYWIDWTQNANITSAAGAGGNLEIGVVGKDGTIALGTPNGNILRFSGINGSETLSISQTSSWEIRLVILVIVGVAGVVLTIWISVRRASRHT